VIEMPRHDIPDDATHMLRSVGCLAREGFMPGEVLARFPAPSTAPSRVATGTTSPRAPMFHRLATCWLAARTTEAMR
jgi:hypothetical protein